MQCRFSPKLCIFHFLYEYTYTHTHIHGMVSASSAIYIYHIFPHINVYTHTHTHTRTHTHTQIHKNTIYRVGQTRVSITITVTQSPLVRKIAFKSKPPLFRRCLVQRLSEYRKGRRIECLCHIHVPPFPACQPLAGGRKTLFVICQKF